MVWHKYHKMEVVGFNLKQKLVLYNMTLEVLFKDIDVNRFDKTGGC